jgi:hypothetical protein
MAIGRLLVVTNGLPAEQLSPGTIVAGGENVLAGALTTVGAGTWLGAAIATGIIRRTGPVGAYIDTTDTATNILLALAGNGPGADVLPGTTFRTMFINTVAQAMTFAAGVGVVVGTGTLDCAASLIREYLWTVKNTTPQVILNCATTNASAVVTFNLPPGQSSLPIGPAVNAVNITPGATVSGTGITAGTTVIGLTMGQGGITGVTLSANATATTNPVALTFGPTILVDTLGTKGL